MEIAHGAAAVIKFFGFSSANAPRRAAGAATRQFFCRLDRPDPELAMRGPVPYSLGMSEIVAAPGRAPRFWVVDDNPDFRELMQVLLTKQGYEALTTASGRECLDWLGQSRPDVILLDVVMPELDGLEVCRRIKSDPRLAGIFVVSGILTPRTNS